MPPDEAVGSGHVPGDPGVAPDTAEFIAVLARFRVVAGESYKSLAARTGVPNSTLYDTLSGRRKPRAEVVERLIRAYARDQDQAAAWLRAWTSLLLTEHFPADDERTDPVDVDAALPGPRSTAHGDGGEAPTEPSAPSAGPVVPRPGRSLHRSVLLVVVVLVVAAGLVASVVALVALDGRGDGPDPRSAVNGAPTASASGATTVVVVYNIEAPCRPLRTLECSLALSRDPWQRSGPQNVAGRVWHGDRLDADCVVSDGRLITDEVGISSHRWYHVRVPGSDVHGWLPGVRTRNSREVADCGTPNRQPQPVLPTTRG